VSKSQETVNETESDRGAKDDGPRHELVKKSKDWRLESSSVALID